MIIRTALPCLALAAVAFLPIANTAVSPDPAPPAQDDVVIQTIPVSGNVSMLVGQGGNIGVSVGPDGAFLIDDQFAPLTGKILAAVAELTDHPARYLLNTHWHGDHTGGNENMGKEGVVLVAHDNVRKRMSVEQFMEAFNRQVPASPDGALPRITFSETVTFHWNGDTVRATHVPNAHTDGDAIVHFEGANVFHMGDTFFNGMYPFIDVGSGGGLEGLIAAADFVLEHSDDDTHIIPGHGPLATPDDLRTYRGMLETARGRIQALIDDGKTRDEVLAASPTEELDEVWGYGFMKADDFVGYSFDSLTR